MYPFSMYGRTVRVHRFKVTYLMKEQEYDEDGAPVTVSVEHAQYCHSREEANAVAKRTGGTITELDTHTYEWLGGIEVADVPDTYAEAVRIYEMGREAYEAELAKPTPEETIVALENQVTDLQLALCDFYESVVV